MIKAIFYKEWIKIRWSLLLISLVYVLTILYTLISMNRSFRFAGDVHLWEMIIQKDLVLIDLLKYLPLIAGVLIAIAQYIPEMIKRKLKLTIHLPLSPEKSIWNMLTFGLVALLLINGIGAIIVSSILHFKLASDILVLWMQAFVPCVMAGFTAYLLTSWVCIEPQWKQRIINIIIALALIFLHFIKVPSGAYVMFVPVLLVFDAFCALFVFFSVSRFRQGVQ